MRLLRLRLETSRLGLLEALELLLLRLRLLLELILLRRIARSLWLYTSSGRVASVLLLHGRLSVARLLLLLSAILLEGLLLLAILRLSRARTAATAEVGR